MGYSYGGYQCSRIPAKGFGPQLTWVHDNSYHGTNHKGADDSFTYMFPVSKYCEAFSAGPVWNDSEAYKIGNQPYNYKDGLNVAYHTPAVPSHFTLVNSAPRYSSAGVQQAQVTMGQLLASRAPGVGL